MAIHQKQPKVVDWTSVSINIYSFSCLNNSTRIAEGAKEKITIIIIGYRDCKGLFLL